MPGTIAPNVSNDELYLTIEKERAAEAAERLQAQTALERRQALMKAIEEARTFQDGGNLSDFATAWAPKWWRAGELLRSTGTFDASALVIPLEAHYQLAVNLLGMAIQGNGFDAFCGELRKAVTTLDGEDRRILVLRQIFGTVTEHLQGKYNLAAKEQQIDDLHLDPSEKEILRDLIKEPGGHQPTKRIAARLTRNPKAIGKSLSRLVKLQLLENEIGKGYHLTWLGRSVAQTISHPTPKQTV